MFLKFDTNQNRALTMMRHLLSSILLLFVCSTSLYAQDIKKSKWIIGPSLGYQYQQKHFVKASLWGLTDLGYANYLRFDAGADFTWNKGKTHIIPELGVTYYLSAKGIWPFIKTEVTHYTITPKVGIGLFNLVEVGAGYGFDLKTKENLPTIKGFNISLGLNLPLNYHLD